MSLLSLGLTWEDSAPRGFQVGRAAALLEHAHRREARAFKKLVKYLHQRNRRADAEKWAREYEQIKRRRLKRRLARAAARPPCPGCGGTVGRVGQTAKIPTYCSVRCGRAARFKRWYEKHGQERNARRRKT